MSRLTEVPQLSFEAMQGFLDSECSDHLPLSFLQGHILAWLVLNSEGVFNHWQMSFFDIFPQLRDALKHSEFLALFWQKTKKELFADDYVLKLALPSDDEQMKSRLTHLSGWAKGFMQPFGDLDASSRKWSDIATELLMSIAALIEVDPDSVSDMSEDDAELHYAEISEFAKLAPYLMMSDEATRNQPDVSAPDTLAE